MSRIRNKDTKPEILVRSMLHGLGLRFTVNGPKSKKLPGRPDIVLPKYKTVIFVHGCFWHGHKNCKDFRIPKTRSEWWREKLEGNAARDRQIGGTGFEERLPLVEVGRGRSVRRVPQMVDRLPRDA